LLLHACGEENIGETFTGEKKKRGRYNLLREEKKKRGREYSLV